MTREDHSIDRDKLMMYPHCGGCRFWHEGKNNVKKDFGVCMKTGQALGRCEPHCEQYKPKISQK